MAASYPGAIWTPTTKTNKVDLVDADHINRPQDEIVALETELGINVRGSAADLKTRLAVIIDDSGVVKKLSSAPSHLQGKIYYDTVLLKYYGSDGTNWIEFGAGPLGNIVFCFCCGNPTASSDGNSGSGFGALGGLCNYYIGQSYNAGESTIYSFPTRFKKISGVNTLTAYFSADHGGASGAQLAIRVNGSAGSFGTCPSSYGWGSTTYDVSGLSNGTVYSMDFGLRHNGGAASGGTNYNSIIVFAS